MSFYLYAIKQSNNSFKNYFLIFKFYFGPNLYLEIKIGYPKYHCISFILKKLIYIIFITTLHYF